MATCFQTGGGLSMRWPAWPTLCKDGLNTKWTTVSFIQWEPFNQDRPPVNTLYPLKAVVFSIFQNRVGGCLEAVSQHSQMLFEYRYFTHLFLTRFLSFSSQVHGNIMSRCLFAEGINSGYTTFQSKHNTNWYLGFKRSGRVKQPHNTTISQKAARFLGYFS